MKTNTWVFLTFCGIIAAEYASLRHVYAKRKQKLLRKFKAHANWEL